MSTLTPEEFVEAAITRALDAFEEDAAGTTPSDVRHESVPLTDNKQLADVVSEHVLLAGLQAEKIHRRVHERARKEGLARECWRDLWRGEGQ
jgi:hypothetical protein